MKIPRAANLLGLAILVSAATLVVAKLDRKIVPNLASGSVVTISSQDSASPDPSRTIDGDTSHFGFHTQSEDSPWVLLDLRSEKLVHHVIIFNRLDCCRERAVPLAIQVSHDGLQFTEVARAENAFDIWDAQIPSQSARFIRAQLLKSGVLHLNEIEVR